jgi:hypothetical protein
MLSVGLDGLLYAGNLESSRRTLFFMLRSRSRHASCPVYVRLEPSELCGMPFYPQLGIPLFSRPSCAGPRGPRPGSERLALTIKLPGPSQGRLTTKTAEGSGGKAVVGRRAEYVSRTLPSVRRVTNSPNGPVEMWESQVPKFLAFFLWTDLPCVGSPTVGRGQVQYVWTVPKRTLLPTIPGLAPP